MLALGTSWTACQPVEIPIQRPNQKKNPNPYLTAIFLAEINFSFLLLDDEKVRNFFFIQVSLRDPFFGQVGAAAAVAVASRKSPLGRKMCVLGEEEDFSYTEDASRKKKVRLIRLLLPPTSITDKCVLPFPVFLNEAQGTTDFVALVCQRKLCGEHFWRRPRLSSCQIEDKCLRRKEGKLNECSYLGDFL